LSQALFEFLSLTACSWQQRFCKLFLNLIYYEWPPSPHLRIKKEKKIHTHSHISQHTLAFLHFCKFNGNDVFSYYISNTLEEEFLPILLRKERELDLNGNNTWKMLYRIESWGLMLHK
jgi:hypothetical protein